MSLKNNTVLLDNLLNMTNNLPETTLDIDDIENVMSSAISSHNIDENSHSDIRSLIDDLQTTAGAIDIDLDNANEGEANIINADTLGGKLASEYATQDFVTTKISEAQLGGEDGVDLSGYATKDDVSTAKSESVSESKTYTNEQVKKAAPRNLLDNSDFEISQVGYGGKYGTAVYAADRWVQNDTTERSYSKTTHNGHSALICTTETRIQQNLYLVEGAVYTASVIIGNNRLITTFTANKGSNGASNLWVNYQYTGQYQFVISSIPANTIVSEPVLYRGEYTLETLPEYQPKGYENELLVCRQYDGDNYIGLRKFGQPRNLLDNSDFINPVNQRGVENGTRISSYTYFIDRWRTIDLPYTYMCNANGLYASEKMNLMQHIPNAEKLVGKTLTFAAKCSGKVLIATRKIVGSTSWDWTPNDDFSSEANSAAIVEQGNGLVYVQIGLYAEGDYVEWAALYEGEYTADTLPEYQPKGYGAELAECQRYYLKMEQPTAVAFPSGDGTGIRVAIKLSVTMRYSPSIVDCRLGWVMWAGDGGYYQGTLTEAISKYGGSTDEIMLLINVGADTITRIGTANPMFAMMSWISLSAEEM